MSTTTTEWTYLSPNPKSSYKQLFIKGTRIRARVLYGWYACEEPRTSEEIAADCMLLSKAGLLGVTHSPARELGAKTITVNAIAPGISIPK